MPVSSNCSRAQFHLEIFFYLNHDDHHQRASWKLNWISSMVSMNWDDSIEMLRSNRQVVAMRSDFSHRTLWLTFLSAIGFRCWFLEYVNPSGCLSAVFPSIAIIFSIMELSMQNYWRRENANSYLQWVVFPPLSQRLLLLLLSVSSFLSKIKYVATPEFLPNFIRTLSAYLGVYSAMLPSMFGYMDWILR